MTADSRDGSRVAGAPRVVVTVGTDHHPFDRLIGWFNDWLGQHPGQAPSCFVQRGSASLLPACPQAQFLDAGQLDALMDEAEVAVCHGGPGSIADAWARGLAPIAVPRLRRHGEVVDDHQVDFCRKLAGLGRVRLAESAAELAALLDEATKDPRSFQLIGPGADTGAAVRRFAVLVDELASRPRGRRALNRRVRGARTGSVTAVRPEADGSTPGLVPAARNPGESSPAHVSLGRRPLEEQE